MKDKKALILPYAEGLSQNLSRTVSKFGLSLISSNRQKLGRSIKSTKDQLKALDKIDSVYSIPCTNCNGVYIGQTKRKLWKRVKEHKSNISKPVDQQTALTVHALNNNHCFDYDNIRVLGQQSNWYKRNLLEMYHISKNNNSVNFRSDVNGLSKVYNNLIG